MADPTIKIGVIGQSNARGWDDSDPDYVGGAGTYNYPVDTWITPIVDPYAGYGSGFAPPFCDTFYSEKGITVGVIPTAVESKGVTLPADNNWSTDSHSVYTDAITKLTAAGPVDFLIMWGSEADGDGAVSKSTFKTAVHLMAANFRRDLSLPNLIIYVVKISHVTNSTYWTIREAWNEIFREDDNIRFCADALGYDKIDNVHVSKAGMVLIGNVIGANIAYDYYNHGAPLLTDSLSAGLVAAYEFDNVGASIATDLTTNGNNIELSNTVITADGLEVSANDEIGKLNNPDDRVLNSEAGTVMIWLKSLSAIDDGVQRALFGKNGTLGIYLRKETNGRIRFLVNDAVTWHYMDIDVTSIPNYTTGTMVSVVWDRNNVVYDDLNIAINIDGYYVTPVLTSSPTWIQFDWYEYAGVGNVYPLSAIFSNCIYNRMYLYNTVKTENTMRAIFANPEIVIDDYYGLSTGRTINKGKGKGL